MSKKVMAEVSEEVHIRFKRACLERKENMKDVLARLMEEYAADHEKEVKQKK